MTAFLVDTHVALWLWSAPERLGAAHRDILYSDARRLLSIVSLWEISIKAGLGKLTSPPDLLLAAEESSMTLLPVEARHALAVRDLPRHHGDPFDRMLIAQAQVEGLTLLSEDRRFPAYGVALV